MTADPTRPTRGRERTGSPKAGGRRSRPIRYEVTLDVEPHLADDVERYMRTVHIPEIFATGCFRCIHFERSLPTRFRTSYQARAQADIDRYLREHTQRLRADFGARFPQGIVLSREVWRELQRWGRGP